MDRKDTEVKTVLAKTPKDAIPHNLDAYQDEIERLRKQLATMETKIAAACAKLALDYYPAPTEDIRAGISKAINAGEWRSYYETA